MLLTLEGGQKGFGYIAYAPDAKTFVTTPYSDSLEDNTAKLWNATSGELILTFEDKALQKNNELSFTHENGVKYAIYSPDGKTIVTTPLRDAMTKVWDCSNWQTTFYVTRA